MKIDSFQHGAAINNKIFNYFFHFIYVYAFYLYTFGDRMEII